MSQNTITSAPSGTNSGLFTAEQRLAATAHFKVYMDGVTPLIRVGNCTVVNGRRIINLNCKTVRDYHANRPNASMSYPVVAGGKATQDLVERLSKQYDGFKKGDLVSAHIEDGYVKAILPASSQQAQEFVIGKPQADDMVDKDTGEVMNAADGSADDSTQDDSAQDESAADEAEGTATEEAVEGTPTAAAPAAPKGKKGAPAVEPVSKDDDDMPF